MWLKKLRYCFEKGAQNVPYNLKCRKLLTLSEHLLSIMFVYIELNPRGLLATL